MLRYEHQLIVAEGDYVIVHGRFSGIGRPVAWVAADIVRIENAAWPNTGTSCKTKRQRRNRRAACDVWRSLHRLNQLFHHPKVLIVASQKRCISSAHEESGAAFARPSALT